MNKQEAADFLNVPIKFIDRYEKAGWLPSQKAQNGGKFYAELDLTQLKNELDGIHPQTEAEHFDPQQSEFAQETISLETMLLRLAEAVEILTVSVRHPQKPTYISTTTIGDKLTLTISEAVTLSGLPRAHIKQAIDNGELVVKTIGREHRIWRRDLEAYISKLWASSQKP
jgi:excisionase family DNA binding protein